MGGVAIQQVFILIFCVFAYRFWRILREQEKAKISTPSNLEYRSGFVLLSALVVVLLLITVSRLLGFIQLSLTLDNPNDQPHLAPNPLPSRRILAWPEIHHSQPRGVPILSRLSPDVTCVHCFKHCPSRLGHERPRLQHSFAKSEEDKWRPD